jgi:hypothetical protein
MSDSSISLEGSVILPPASSLELLLSLSLSLSLLLELDPVVVGRTRGVLREVTHSCVIT